MTREISQDCMQLISFFQTYNFESQLANSKFKSELTTMHKKVFGYLTFIAEVEFQNSQVKFLNDKSIGYFKESGSDLIQSLFCWVNGTYKPAEMLLRSSIETFIKAILGISDDKIFIEKSMYKLFELVGDHTFFKGDYRKEEYLARIHSNYKLLCMTTHTATLDNLISVDTLKLLPRFNSKTSEHFSSLYLSTINMILGTVLINFRDKVFNMHPKNRTNFFDAIPLKIKNEIMSI
jgi:hypothetical protein